MAGQKLIKVVHADASKREKLGYGFITGTTTTTTLNEKKEKVLVVYAHVSWDGVRSPAISFHTLDELAWTEIEGVDEEMDLLANTEFEEGTQTEEEVPTEGLQTTAGNA